MRAYWTLVRRELGGYFLSFMGYIILAATLLLNGGFLFVAMIKGRGEHIEEPLTKLYFAGLVPWIVILTTPVITMRLFALEKFSGTFETLMTTPVTELQVVMAKFSGALLFYLIVWAPLLGCFLLVKHYTNDNSPLDAGVMASTFFGLLLLGGLLVSAGSCASALTRSQVIAVILALAFGAGLLGLGYLTYERPDRSNLLAQAVACFALFDQMHDFARGVVDTQAVVLFGSLTLFFLFLNLRIVESRRWK